MSPKISPESEALRKEVRELARNEFMPKARKWDETDEYPMENVKKLAELGILGLTIPEEYGGSGWSLFNIPIVTEEIAYACPITAFLIDPFFLTSRSILIFGSEEQKKKWIPAMINAEKIPCFALTEPGGGSDVVGMKTVARKEGDEYVINGEKVFNTQSLVADVYLVFAKTDPAKGPKGISAFLVERNSKGLELGNPIKMLGLHGVSIAPLVFKDVRVPAENLVGKEGEGLKIGLGQLNEGRVQIAAVALGIAQRALEEAIEYSKQRKAFGQTISKFQHVQRYITDMAVWLEASRLLTYEAASLLESEGAEKEAMLKASMAKLFATETAAMATGHVIQIMGGYGYTKDFVAEKLYRDARVLTIVEGTTEIQRLIIARRLLGRDYV
jgi:alkylation response protein AidB-like acyl-CoA dehydrogenase